MAVVSEIEKIRAVLDAYGVGVRAGVITPCMEDEVAFRELLNLPAMPPRVKQDWDDAEGIRRPITLQRPDATEGPDPLAVDTGAQQDVQQ